MRAAVVTELGQPPACGEFPEPSAGAGEVIVSVRAAAISQLVRARASGRHYSFDGRVPFVAGVDGTGVLPDGRRVYFALPTAPFGAMAERAPVREALCVPLPEGLDEIRAAALANPGMSSWMALRERAAMRPGETVLVNGATGSSGRLAVQIARHLGARRVIATGRNTAVLAQLGADEVIPLGETGTLAPRLEAAFAGGVDVVLDYLWGASAEAILAAAVHARPAEARRRFVQIGSISGERIALPGAWLRSSAIEIMGSGIGSVSMERMMVSIGDLLAAADPAGFEIATSAVPLDAVARAWAEAEASHRPVICLG